MLNGFRSEAVNKNSSSRKPENGKWEALGEMVLREMVQYIYIYIFKKS